MYFGPVPVVSVVQVQHLLLLLPQFLTFMDLTIKNSQKLQKTAKDVDDLQVASLQHVHKFERKSSSRRS